jgi:5-dehydro-4-deoxyglucarate dehydratase
VTPYSPPELAATIGRGLLSFPVTPFQPDSLELDVPRLRAHLDALGEHPVAGLFAAGGTGEVFSLEPHEIDTVVRETVAGVRGRVPVLAPASGSTRAAVAQARAAEAAGADGILLFPPYLTETSADGMVAHVTAVARATGLGIVLYARANARYDASVVRRLVDALANVVGYKDGTGDLFALGRIAAEHGDRLVYIGGVPTAEVLAPAYRAAGASTYSSALFNVLPEFALRFYDAVRAGNEDTVRSGLIDVLYPWVDLRDRRAGYAVSIVKAGLEALGRSAGPVRPPLTDLLPEELAEVRRVLARAEAVAA